MLLVGAIVLAVLVLPSPWGVVAVALAGLVEVVETAFWIRLSRRRRIRVGAETLVGERAVVVTPCRPDGQVRISGEIWNARCASGAGDGETVRVLSVDGLTLTVEPDR